MYVNEKDTSWNFEEKKHKNVLSHLKYLMI